MNIALTVILLLAAVFLVVVVLIQSGKSDSLYGAITGGSSETFFGKNKSQSRDKLLDKLTAIVAAVFVVLVLIVYIVQDDSDLDALKDQLDNASTTDVDTTVEPADSSETTD